MLTPVVDARARAVPSRCQEPGPSSGSVARGVGPSSTAFLVVLADSWVCSGAAKIQTSVHVGRQHHRPERDQLCHNANLLKAFWSGDHNAPLLGVKDQR